MTPTWSLGASGQYYHRKVGIGRGCQRLGKSSVICAVLTVLMLTALQGCRIGAMSLIDSRNKSEDSLLDANRRLCLEELREEYRRVVGPFIEGRHAVLVDMVFHWNLGDSFIQHGEHLLMEDFGTPPSIPCALEPGTEMFCNIGRIEEAIANDPRDSIILIHGGGNFGDLYPSHSQFVNRIVKHFPSVPILYLPQSVFYKKKANAVMDASIRSGHPNITMLARDARSLAAMKAHFPRHRSLLCPDGAQRIGPVDDACAPAVDVLFLTRRDNEGGSGQGSLIEAITAALADSGLTWKVTDWFDWKEVVNDARMPSNPLEFPHFKTKIGVKILCQGRFIVTNRLHATIMSTLIGLPHSYLDNSYGKVTGYREAIFAPRPKCSDANLRAFKASTWLEGIQFAKEFFKVDQVASP